jgi:hypothetical protein
MDVARRNPPRKLALEDAVALLRQRYGGRLLPSLEGLAYRFTIWLPVQSQGMPVFTEEHKAHLYDLFHDCFGGYTQFRLEGFPPWSVSWLPSGRTEPVVDHHIVLILYTLQDAAATARMRQLKWILQQQHVAAQQIVLIEQVPVQLVEAEELAAP